MKRNRLMAFALALTMALSLCACWADTDPQVTDPTSATSSAVTNPNALHYGLYVQDGKLFYVNFVDEISILQIGDNLIQGNLFNWTLMGYTSDVFLSRDGRYMIYPQGEGINPETHGGYVPDYYYIDLTSPEQEPIFVGTGVIRHINEEFNLFTQAGSEELYQYDLNGRIQVSTDIPSYHCLHVSKDGKCIYYITYLDEALYRWTAEEGATLIAKGVTWCEAAEDFNTVFYLVDDRLYVKKQGEQEQLLGSKTGDTGIQVNEDGTAYFYTVDDHEGYNDYGDAIMWGDSIMTLHYYDGQKTHIICDEVTDDDIMAYDFSETFYKTATGTFIAAKNSVGELPKGSIVYFYDGNYAIVRIQDNETQESSFYRLTIQGTQILEEELLIDGLTGRYSVDHFGSSVICMKNIIGESFLFSEKFNGEYYTTEAGTLYLNSQYIDDNVKYQRVISDEQNRNGLIYYLKDWTPETFLGTLCVYDGEKAETVMDNVYEMVLTPGGELMFLRNYDLTTYAGELWVYQDGACCKLADNVSQILTATDLS